MISTNSEDNLLMSTQKTPEKKWKEQQSNNLPDDKRGAIIEFHIYQFLSLTLTSLKVNRIRDHTQSPLEANSPKYFLLYKFR